MPASEAIGAEEHGYTARVVRIPADLERKLTELFPRVRERERFIADVLRAGLEGKGMPAEQDQQPLSIGGTLHLFSDGGSRGNPGKAAIACILEDPVRGEVLAQHAETIGVETNNVAEYKALIAGLRLARSFQPNRLICHLDSELVVKQLNGEYRVRMEALRPFIEEIRELAADLPDVVFVHIPRQDNHRADALVNKVLDQEERERRSHGIPAKPSPQPRRPEQPQARWDW